jgi:hypothetical protein
MGPSSLQGEKSVLAVHNWRQSTLGVTMTVWYSYGFYLLGEPPLLWSSQAELSRLLLLLVGRFLLKVEGEFLEPTKASCRIQLVPTQSATC